MRTDLLSSKTGLLLVLMGTPVLLIVAAMVDEWISGVIVNHRRHKTRRRPF